LLTFGATSGAGYMLYKRSTKMLHDEIDKLKVQVGTLKGVAQAEATEVAEAAPEVVTGGKLSRSEIEEIAKLVSASLKEEKKE